MSVPQKKKDDSFKEHVLDQLEGLSGLRAQSMFGGWGFYSGDAFFGLIAYDRLFFRVDDTTRPKYEERGMKPFVYSREGKSATMGYFEVPEDVFENRDELARWAARAVEVARAAKTGRKRKKV